MAPTIAASAIGVAATTVTAAAGRAAAVAAGLAATLRWTWCAESAATSASELTLRRGWWASELTLRRGGCTSELALRRGWCAPELTGRLRRGWCVETSAAAKFATGRVSTRCAEITTTLRLARGAKSPSPSAVRARASEAVAPRCAEAALVPVIHNGRADAHRLLLPRSSLAEALLVGTRLIEGLLVEGLIKTRPCGRASQVSATAGGLVKAPPSAAILRRKLAARSGST